MHGTVALALKAERGSILALIAVPLFCPIYTPSLIPARSLDALLSGKN